MDEAMTRSGIRKQLIVKVMGVVDVLGFWTPRPESVEGMVLLHLWWKRLTHAFNARR
ncbi:unnamed protein product [Lupinus luteus]|uniref:Uncharacterized protein n=1 Tax=Lupinus luteus TaxID=3873 RepID=A0AAV1Y2L1_LUPLU